MQNIDQNTPQKQPSTQDIETARFQTYLQSQKKETQPEPAKPAAPMQTPESAQPKAEPNLFRRLWDLGYRRLIPIVPPGAPISERSTLHNRLKSGRDDRGKAPGVKGFDGLWRGFNWIEHETTEEDLDRWHAMAAGCGIVTGRQPDGSWLIANDIDSMSPEQADQANACAVQILGKSPVRFGRRPKRLSFYRSTEKITYQCIEFKGPAGKNERVEVLAEGRQAVGLGVHSITRAPYEWPDGIRRFDHLPFVTASEIDAYFQALHRILPEASAPVAEGPAVDRSKIDQKTLEGEDMKVSKAVRALPNTPELFPTYADMVRVGQAIYAATRSNPALGKELWDDWYSKYPDYDPDRAASYWRSFKAPHSIGAEYLYLGGAS